MVGEGRRILFGPIAVAAWDLHVARPTSDGPFATAAAARGWEIVATPGQFCPMGTPVERLVEAERLVPGTAGFVVWYLRHVTRARLRTRRLLQIGHTIGHDSPIVAVSNARIRTPSRSRIGQ